MTDELQRINSSSGMKRLSLPSFWARQTGRLLWRTGETLFLARPFPRLRDFRSRDWIRYWQRDFQMTRSQVDALLLKADHQWRAAMRDPVLNSRVLNQRELSAPERAAIGENPGVNLAATYNALKKYEEALPFSKDAGKYLKKLIDSLKESLKQEEAALSGIQKLKALEPGALETWVAQLERFRKGEFRGPRTDLGNHFELQFSNDALQQATTLRLLDGARLIDHLRAIETRLRIRFQSAEFAASSSQLSALKGFGERIIEVQERLNLELGRRSNLVPKEIARLRWVDLIEKLKKDRWVSPEASLDPATLRQAMQSAKVVTEPPPSLRNMKGQWQMDASSKPFDIYFLRTPGGSVELFIGREIFGEWRLISRFPLGVL